MNALAQQIQALLFTAGEAVPFSELAQLTKSSEKDIANALQELAESLQESGLAIITTATHAEISTSGSVAEFLAQFNTKETPALSKAALETLSVIAYKGPLPRFEIDVVRGVDSRHMIKQLFARGLVRQLKISGAAPQYDITEEFLAHLGITRKEELPDFETLS